MLDVGCGTRPKGDVNVDFFSGGFNPQEGDQARGEFLSPRKIRNFVVADAMHLPFRDEGFNVVFSSHTIEHVKNPALMLREMCRVAKRKAILRCPHRKGTGAVRPFHLNYMDEAWFQKASVALGLESRQLVTSFDYPVTERIKLLSPKTLFPFIEKTTAYRAIRRLERTMIQTDTLHIPFELEVWFRKKSAASSSSVKLVFVVVYDDADRYRTHFGSSPYVSEAQTVAVFNENNESLPKIYNRVVKDFQQDDIWFAFCHQDFVLSEDLVSHMKGKNTDAVYGLVGAIYGHGTLYGQVLLPDDKQFGIRLREDLPVQTLDEMCLIVHSKTLREGLSFDERFGSYFYGADFCMQAYVLGFDVMATQVSCQRKNSMPHGRLTSPEYLSALHAFREKWKPFLPVRTSTQLIE